MFRDLLKNDRFIFFLTVSSILYSPFLIFLQHNKQDFFRPESLFVLLIFLFVGGSLSIFQRRGSNLPACFIYAAFLVLLVDIQLQWPGWFGKALLAEYLGFLAALWIFRQHIHRILLTIFAVSIVGTILLSAFDFDAHPRSTTLRAAERADLPTIVHIILDEHISINGIPTDIPGGISAQNELKEFYRKNGFVTFGSAYSPYAWTLDAIPTTLNFVETPSPYHYSKPGKSASQYFVTANKYFENIVEKGYGIRVYQAAVLDFCQKSPVPLISCTTYQIDDIHGFENYSENFWRISYVLINKYLQMSFLYREIKSFYQTLKMRLEKSGISLPSPGIDLPKWVGWSATVGPIATLPVVEKLASDLAFRSKGIMFFAHLLAPHHPYSLTSNCQVRQPLFSWKGALPFQLPANTDPDKDRRIRYQLYFDQIRCSMSQLQKLFDGLRAQGIFDDAIIIIHGDHGSRISTTEPTKQNYPKMKGRDFLDLYATHFAAKLPGQKSDFIARPIPVWRLLKSVFDGTIRAVDTRNDDHLYLEDSFRDMNARARLPDTERTPQQAVPNTLLLGN